MMSRTDVHGGQLVNLIVSETQAGKLRQQSLDWSSWDLSERQLCDLELLLNGGFSPLTGFMNRADYESVCTRLRLADGTLWSMPITLDVSEAVADSLSPGDFLALRDPEGVMLAALETTDVWRPDLAAEAEAVLGTGDLAHPGVAHLLKRTHPCYVGGRLHGLRLPVHYDFREVRLAPAELGRIFARLGWRRVVAFPASRPMHRRQFEASLAAAHSAGGNLLIHPMLGPGSNSAVDDFTRVRCYQALMPRYPRNMARLALLPLATRQGGPREVLWQAVVQQNFGCSHFVVDPDHASPESPGCGRSFYPASAARELFAEYKKELGIELVARPEMVYAEGRKAYFVLSEVPKGARILEITPPALRQRLAKGRDIPEWFTFPEVAAELKRRSPPRYRQGFAVFFTGLSGSGKSTIAKVLRSKLLEMGGRTVTLLDGDLVRKNLSSELGFSRPHRDLNIRRIGFVAAEITKAGGIALCAPIAPYDDVRKDVRAMVEPHGGFVLVHLGTPLQMCEKRDRKGMYAKARAGIIKEFTGISDPYQEPEDAEVVIDTSDETPEEGAQEILLFLEREGYIPGARMSSRS